MVTVAHPVGHLQQITQYDCWHASLRMMTKWRNGAASEPTGTHTQWLYIQCVTGENGFNATRANALVGIAAPDEIEDYHATRTAQQAVKNWSRTRTLTSSGGTHRPFTQRPGLTISLLPTILAENKLRSVRGTAITEELDGTSGAIGAMLTGMGPLYMLINWGHVVVVTGINGDTLDVSDPLLAAPSTLPRSMLEASPCVARLA